MGIELQHPKYRAPRRSRREPSRATIEVAIEGFECGTSGFGVEVRQLVTQESMRRLLASDGVVHFTDLAPGVLDVVVVDGEHAAIEFITAQ